MIYIFFLAVVILFFKYKKMREIIILLSVSSIFLFFYRGLCINDSVLFVKYISAEETVYYTNTDKPSVEEYDKLDKDNILKKIYSFIIQIDDVYRILLAVVLYAIISVYYKNIFLIKYCKNLKNKVYDTNHLWLGDKNLENIIVPICANVSETNEVDISDYFDERLKSEERFWYIVLGNPGAGKSVALKKITYSLCNNFINLMENKKIKKKNKRCYIIPVLIDFIEIANISNVDMLENFIISRVYNLSIKRNFILRQKWLKKYITNNTKKIIKDGNIALFFDGYDELNDGNRYVCLNLIKEFNAQLSNCNIIISSRSSIFNRKDFVDKSPIYLEIMPFSNKIILDFLAKWDFDVDKNYFDLYQKILDNIQLQRLSSNPLMLTLISYLYDKNELREPQTILQFYEQGVNCLLENWEDETKRINKLKISLKTKFTYLCYVSYYLYTINEFDFSKDDILCETNQISNYGVTSNEAFDEIFKYSGLIEKISNDLYKFHHRSFLDFFLAYYIRDNARNIIYDIRKNHYQVFLFYFSLIDDTDEIEKFLLKKIDEIDDLSILKDIILECNINNTDIIFRYLEKIFQKDNKDLDFYQHVGNIASKYKYMSLYIDDFLNKELVYNLFFNDIKAFYIIKAYALFLSKDKFTDKILPYIDKINWQIISSEINIQLEQFIIQIYSMDIDKEIKYKICNALADSEQYSTLFAILKKEKDEDYFNNIMLLLLYKTKSEFFVQWLKKQNITYIFNEEIVKKCKQWAETLGWYNDDIPNEYVVQKYLFVYFYIYKFENIDLLYEEISERIKFVAEYIKKFFLDNKINPAICSDYKEINNKVEFEYHWNYNKRKKTNYKTILYDFKFTQKLSYFLSYIICICSFFYYLYFRNMIYVAVGYKNKLIDEYIADNTHEKYQLYKQFMEYFTYNFSISNITNKTTILIISMIIMIYCNVQTYNLIINKTFKINYLVYNFIIYLLFVCIWFVFFSDVVFRLCGLLSGLLIFVIANFRYKYNMSSFKEPLFSNIRKKLMEDIF